MGKTTHIDRPLNTEPLVTRAEGVRKGLVAAYEAGRGSPNEVVGNEREIFISKYLDAAYPRSLRVGRGFIVDKSGSTTGQLDIVIEKTQSMSLPGQAGDGERLFFAEMVAAIISVKSNLHAQWDQFKAEVDKVNQLVVSSSATFTVNKRNGGLPVFLVAYSGAANLEGIHTKIENDASLASVRAIAVLDKNLFLVRTPPDSNRWIGSDERSAFLMFMAELHKEIATAFEVGESIWEYVVEVTNT